MTKDGYGKSCSFIGDRRNNLDPDRRGSVPGVEVWDPSGKTAGRYPDRGEERIVLFPDRDIDRAFHPANDHSKCDRSAVQEIIAGVARQLYCRDNVDWFPSSCTAGT